MAEYSKYEQKDYRESRTPYPVTYVDPRGIAHNAIVTREWHWDENSEPLTINLVYVSKDETKHDQYGRQIERATSVQSKKQVGDTPGNYFILN